MITVSPRELERHGISMSRAKAAQEVRQSVGVNEAAAVRLINQLLGGQITDVAPNIPHNRDDTALMVAQYVVDQLVQANGQPVDPSTVLSQAVTKTEQLLNLPRMSWTFQYLQDVAPSAVSADGEMSVPVRADGTIKKGGRGPMAEHLYRKHVLEAEVPMSNPEFVHLLVKELQMTKSGASTYAYNCRRKLGEKQ